jgi:hypothetical protein
LDLGFPIVPDDSFNEPAPANGQPVDKAYRSRAMRVLVPIWALLALGNLIWTIVGKGDTVVYASFLFVIAVLSLIRLRWPMDTWPEWLFTYKP